MLEDQKDQRQALAQLVAACLWDCEDYYADILERWSSSACEDSLPRPIAAELGEDGRIEVISGGESYTLRVEKREG